MQVRRGDFVNVYSITPYRREFDFLGMVIQCDPSWLLLATEGELVNYQDQDGPHGPGGFAEPFSMRFVKPEQVEIVEKPDLMPNWAVCVSSLCNTITIPWETASASKPWNALLLKTLNDKAIAITRESCGVICQDKIGFALSKNLAIAFAESLEMHEYYKASAVALASLRDSNNPNRDYGFPPTVYGYAIRIDEHLPDNTIEVLYL